MLVKVILVSLIAGSAVLATSGIGLIVGINFFLKKVSPPNFYRE